MLRIRYIGIPVSEKPGYKKMLACVRIEDWQKKERTQGSQLRINSIRFDCFYYTETTKQFSVFQRKILTDLDLL